MFGTLFADMRPDARVERISPEKSALADGAVVIAEENKETGFIGLEGEMATEHDHRGGEHDETSDHDPSGLFVSGKIDAASDESDGGDDDGDV